MSEGNNKKQNEPVKKPTKQEARREAELSEQDLNKVTGGANKESEENTIRNATTTLEK